MIVGVAPGRWRASAALAAVVGADVVHLERLPPGTPDPALAERVAALAIAAGHIPVVLDAAGVGRAVVDLLRARGLAPVAVTLTGGAVMRVAGREASLPRAALFGPLADMVGTGRLRVASGLPYGRELALELQAGGGRGGGRHADLVTAVALAVWWQERATGTVGPSRPGTNHARPDK